MKFFSLLLSLFVVSTGFSQVSYPGIANTATELAARPIPPTAPTTVLVALLVGVTTVGDGNGGMFYWSYSSTDTPDNQNVFLSNNPAFASAGRWLRFPLVAPTPGQVSTPLFSPSNPNFTTTVDVSITTSTAGASIFYTTDGSTPTSISTLYTVPITITVDTPFKAIGIKAGLVDSDISSKTYHESTTTMVIGWYGSSVLDTVVGQDWDSTLTTWSQTTVDYNTTQAFYNYPATIAAGGTAAGPYRYYIVIDDGTLSPSAIGGFFVSLNLGPEDFAGVAEGYPNLDDNNWPCIRLEELGIDYRIYRLLNELNGAFTLRVQQF